MFDLQELDRAEAALRELRGQRPQPKREPAPAPRPDISLCPFHNGTMDRREIAA